MTQEGDRVFEEPTTYQAARGRAVPEAELPRRPVQSPGGPRWYQRHLVGRVDPKDLATFCRQFASYLDAGVNLNRALEGLRRQYEGTALGPVLARLQLAVRRGETLSDAVARDPGTFDQLFRSMLRVAEVRGGVPETLRMLSENIEARRRLVRQAKSALIYPSIVIFLATLLGALFTIVVLPKLVGIMQDMVRFKKIALPWPTRVLFGFSNYIRAGGWWQLPLAGFGIVFFLMILYRTRFGKSLLDEIVLQIPILGSLVRQIDTSRFARSLAALLDGGVDIGLSLELTSEILLLAPLRRAVLRAREAVLEGGSLSENLDASRRFPADLIAFVQSGEDTGRLPEMLTVVADDYEEQVDYMVKNIGSIIQPLILLFVGGIVFFIVIAFFMGYTAVLSTLASAR